MSELSSREKVLLEKMCSPEYISEVDMAYVLDAVIEHTIEMYDNKELEDLLHFIGDFEGQKTTGLVQAIISDTVGSYFTKDQNVIKIVHNFLKFLYESHEESKVPMLLRTLKIESNKKHVINLMVAQVQKMTLKTFH